MEERFRTETFNPIATLVIPGTFAIAPWLILAVANCPPLAAFLAKHEITFGTVAVIAAIATGFVLEDLGARIEKIWDCVHRKKIDVQEDWLLYLRTAYPLEPIGHRYLRTIVLRMKFELSFGLSIFVMILGLVALNRFTQFASEDALIAIVGLSAVLAVYVLFESCRSCLLLAETRNNLLKGINSVPSAPHGAD